MGLIRVELSISIGTDLYDENNVHKQSLEGRWINVRFHLRVAFSLRRSLDALLDITVSVLSLVAVVEASCVFLRR